MSYSALFGISEMSGPEQSRRPLAEDKTGEKMHEETSTKNSKKVQEEEKDPIVDIMKESPLGLSFLFDEEKDPIVVEEKSKTT